MSGALTTILGLGLSAGSKIAGEFGNEALSQQLDAYGLSAGAMSSAASDNAEYAVAGVIAGAAVVLAAVPITEPIVVAAVAYYGLTGSAAAAFEIGLSVGFEYAIATDTQKFVTSTLQALGTILNTQATSSAINQAFASYGSGELYNAQTEMDSSAAMWSAAGKALSSAGESLYNDIKSIGSYFPGLFSVNQNQNGTETIIINNENPSNNWTMSELTLTQQQTISSSLIDYSNGTSQVDTYNPSSGVSEEITNYSSLDATGTITAQTLDLAATSGSGSDQITASGDTINIPDNTTATITGSGDTIIGGSADTLTVDGSDTVFVNGTADVVNMQSGDVLAIGSNASATLNSGGVTVDLNGAAASITSTASGDTVDFWGGGDGATISDGTINAAVSGIGVAISGSGDTINVYDTGDTVFVNGTADVVTMQPGDVLAIGSNASATLDSGGATIDLNGPGAVLASTVSGETAYFYGGGIEGAAISNAAMYVGANGSSVVVDGTGDAITAWTNDTLYLKGNSNTLTLGGSGNTAEITGSSVTVDAEVTGNNVGVNANTSVTINGTNNNTIDIWGNNSQVTTSAAETVQVGANGSTATIIGNSDTIEAWSNDNMTVNGQNSQVVLNENNNNVTISGGNDAIKAFGTGEYINILSGVGYVINASNSTILEYNNLAYISAKIEGSNVSIYDESSAGSGNLVLAGNGTDGNNSVYNVYGNGFTIYAVPNVSITVHGGDNSVFGDNLNVDFIGPSNYIAGQNNNWASNGTKNTSNSSNAYNITESSNEQDSTSPIVEDTSQIGPDNQPSSPANTVQVNSLGVVAGRRKLVNVVGQFDLAHGYTAAASAADAAWNNMEQAIAAAASPGKSPAPSPFEHAKWTTPVVTWSFATSPGPDTTPFSGYIQPRYRATVAKAIQVWAKAAGLTLVQVPDSSAADIRIGWGNFDTGTSGVIGYTSFQDTNGQFQPGVVVRLENPAQDPFVTGPGDELIYSGTQVDLSQLVLHEIGHALGLAESSNPNSVMFPELGTQNRTIAASDGANIHSLYDQTDAQGSQMAGLLAQAIASFGTPPSPSLTSAPTLPPEHGLAILASARH